MKSKLNEELKDIHFEGKDNVLKHIKSLDYKPSYLSRILNFEIVFPVPVVAVSVFVALLFMVTTISTNNNSIYQDYTIYVIDQGGHHEIY